jgi:acetolactate synthase-1/2/3 large subunit
VIVTNGADILVSKLIEKDIKTIFCISGAGNLAIIDAIVREGSIRLIYSHHEQAAVMAAQGYARVSGKIGVALVTTGGGAANTLTGILSAYLDSIPVVIISGNESSFHCKNNSDLRAYGVQGFDVVKVMEPVTKLSLRIIDALDVASDLNRVWVEASQDRKGPVLLDFPMDLQRRIVNREDMKQSDNNFNLPQIMLFNENLYQEIEAFKFALSKSSKPLVYIGNGCRGNDELVALTNFLTSNKLPYCLSWSAADLLSSDDDFNMGHIGIYGDRAANIALQKADLLLCIGNRLAIPQIGYDKPDFGRKAIKWVVEIDPTECAKFIDTDWHILNMPALHFLKEFSAGKGTDSHLVIRDKWLGELKELWTDLPRMDQVGPLFENVPNVIHSATVIDYLNSNLHDDAIIVTDVGAGLLTGHYIFAPYATQRFFTSQGLGEMGFGLPGAIGAYFAAPKRQLVCLNTDGGIMFNLQELQVISEHKIPIKLFIFNNDGYSMIKISQQNLFAGRMAGSGLDSGVSFPSFELIAKTFGLQHIRIDSNSDLISKLKPNLENSLGVLVEIIMSPAQKYLPRLATTKLDDGTLVSPPLEDLDPLLPLEDLERFLGYKAHINSYKARGIPYA